VVPGQFATKVTEPCSETKLLDSVQTGVPTSRQLTTPLASIEIACPSPQIEALHLDVEGEVMVSAVQFSPAGSVNVGELAASRSTAVITASSKATMFVFVNLCILSTLRLLNAINQTLVLLLCLRRHLGTRS
jgi:hypothetical protein